jgi:malonyl-CoA O-methyltransferase
MVAMMTVINEISKAFNQQAAEYEVAARVQQEIGLRLFERLNYLNISPKFILDLGCGPGVFSRNLALMYPKAQIIGLDLAHAMLMQAKKKRKWRQKWSLLAADMQHMPFASGLFDLVFANQVIHWGSSLPPVFREINRVMNVNACFMFTTLGPDSFQELKTAWSGVNSYAHTNEFSDMHDVGDILMQEHFLDPVMDMERLAVHYETLDNLLKSLRAQGVRNINPQRNKGLTGKGLWQNFEKNYADLKTDKGKYPLSYEVVYGHAWKGSQRKMERGVETLIPISKIQKI